jgi:hypothetical protein
MPQWIALSRTDHAETLYWPRNAYHFAAENQVVPILIAELGKLMPHFPLGFVSDEHGLHAVALLGLGEGRNLYVTPEGQWLGSYVPALLRGHPFRVVPNERGQVSLCIDKDHLTDEPSAKPLFNDEGNLAKPVAQTLEFLKQCEQNRQATQACTQKLADAGVIEAWPLQVKQDKGQAPKTLRGLHRINEKALNALDAETFHTLRGGPLSLAYAQMLSTHQLNQLTQRAELLSKAGSTQEMPENLDSLFDSEDDDLTFDFDS